MSKSMFHKINVLFLAAALVFGQLGAGFFHNRHDAHETVVDLDHTVLLPHGEHCKICSVDWVHQFIATDNTVQIAQEEFQSFEQVPLTRFISLTKARASGRAPPVA